MWFNTYHLLAKTYCEKLREKETLLVPVQGEARKEVVIFSRIFSSFEKRGEKFWATYTDE